MIKLVMYLIQTPLLAEIWIRSDLDLQKDPNMVPAGSQIENKILSGSNRISI